MFEHLQSAPPDPILGLMAQFQRDTREPRIDLGVGVYRDDEGRTPIMTAVREAEQLRLAQEQTKSYLGMAGDPAYNTAIEQLVFGDHGVRRDQRIATVQTPGGTAALRIAAELIRVSRPGATVWLSDPSWDNHASVFRAAGLGTAHYPYYDPGSHGLREDAMLAALARVGKGDVVLLHACCHNPTGVDLTPAMWNEVAALATQRGFVPLVDMAYQGLGDGLDEDAHGPRLLASRLPELLLCTSNSKNFGLYRERTGAVSVIATDAAQARTAASVMLSAVRNLYSMPPAHGAAIVQRILDDDALSASWQAELAQMRGRLQQMRALAVQCLQQAGVARDVSFITRQRGMFSFLGLTPAQVTRLREEFAVYVLISSRINVAGLSADNIDHFARSVASVLRD